MCIFIVYMYKWKARLHSAHQMCCLKVAHSMNSCWTDLIGVTISAEYVYCYICKTATVFSFPKYSAIPYMQTTHNYISCIQHVTVTIYYAHVTQCVMDKPIWEVGSLYAACEVITVRTTAWFEVFTLMTMKNGVFWDVTPCGSCKNRRFGGT
jgi:hypothetical protein